MNKILVLLVMGLVMAINFNLDPPHYYLNIKPGETVRKIFKVKNNGQDILSFKVYLNDWIYKDNEKIFMPYGSTTYSLEGSVYLYPQAFELNPQEEKSVMMNVAADKNAISGEYGVVFFEASPLSEVKQKGIGLGGRIGSLIYKEIEGRALADYDLSSFKASLVADKLYFKFDLKNKGNVLLKPKMTAILMDDNNNIINRQDFLDIFVFPEKVYQFSNFFRIDKSLIKSNQLSLLLTFDFGDNRIVMQEIKVSLK